jgi:hypothetical protein
MEGNSLTIASADEPDGCAKNGWHTEGNGTSFTFCTATQGYGQGLVRLRCGRSAFCQPLGPLEKHPLGLCLRTLLDRGFDLFNQVCFQRLNFEG